MNSYTDEQLMVRARDGDPPALGMLFERHHRQVFNYFLRWLGNRGAAEDLVQDVFFRMLKYRHTYCEDLPWKVWMFRIAKNAGRDHLKRYGPEVRPAEVPEMADPTQALQHVQNRLDLQGLQKALAKLSPDKREVLILSRFHDLKYDQIAQILDCSVAAVKVRVHRAVRELRDGFHTQVGKELA